MAERRVKRRKPAGQRKQEYLRVRVTDALREGVRKAAESKQISVSAWMTQALIGAVRAEGIDV